MWKCVSICITVVTALGLIPAWAVFAEPAAPAAVVQYISDEQGGTGLTARKAVDQQDDAWRTAATSAGACGFTQGTISAATLPTVLTTGSGFTAQVSLRDMGDMSANSTGTAAGTQGSAGSTTSTTMQDNAPKPQTLYTAGEAYYKESSGSTSSRNALLFTFAQPIRAFGAWLGDVETRTDGNGTTALLRLLDDSGVRIGDDIQIPTSTADQSLCGAPVNDSYVGCGNRTTRWIGFVADDATPVKQMLVIVGDDDSQTGSNDGNTEHLSFIGATVALKNCPTAITLRTLDTRAAPVTPLAVALPALGLVAAGGVVAYRRRKA